MTITYPLLTVVDDSGAIVAGATVAIASVKDKAGTDVTAPGATVAQSGANVSVDYDAEAKGEAWVVLAISKVGSTFTGTNAAPAFYLAKDSSRILTDLDAQVSTLAATAGLASGTVVAGSTGSAVVVAGLPAGKSYAGQHLYHAASGEARTIASQSYSAPNYTFNFAGSAGTEAGPFSAVSPGDVVCPAP